MTYRQGEQAQARGLLIGSLHRLQMYGPDAAGHAILLALAAVALLSHDDEALQFAHKVIKTINTNGRVR